METQGLRIGIDGSCWLNQRGYGRYIRCLLTALAEQESADQYFLCLDPETAKMPDLPARFEKVIIETSRPPAEAASASGSRSPRDLWKMGRAVARLKCDVFFFPSVYTFFPLVGATRAIVAIHDVIAEHHPEMVFSHRRYQLFWNLKQALAIRQARLILTVSDHARQGIVEHFKLPEARVRVILEAPDPIFQRAPEARDPAEVLPQCELPPGCRYLLYVGGLSPHKNLPVLIEAFRRLTADGAFPELRLLLVGDYKGDVFFSAYEGLRATVAEHKLENRVLFTGFVPDAALVELYNRADALVLPSLEEGFGLPAFEAAACGTPVVTSVAGPAGALLGEAAITFEPRDVDALTNALDTLLSDPARRQAMGEEGLRKSATFRWERAAAQLQAMFHEIGQARNGRA